MNETVITTRGLRKSYETGEAVRGVDLDVRRGEVFAFLGANGAGKTTTVEILEGYRDATAGEVRVLGADPARPPRGWRERLGIVLQSSHPESLLSVRECLELYPGYYPAPRPVDEVLALAGLEDQAGERAGRLSGGQRRRLDVGLALIGDPDLVFLDEPTTGFDPSARRAAWETIDGLRELGKTIFLTTHYMEEAERLADRVAVIVGGRIVAEGAPGTLAGRDHALSSIEFALPPGAGLPERLRERAERSNGRVAIASPAPLRDLRDLADWALGRGLELDDLEVRRPTLEDVYLDLTTDEARSPR